MPGWMHHTSGLIVPVEYDRPILLLDDDLTLPISNNLVTWLRADRVTLNGSSVSTVYDVGPLRDQLKDIVQATGANQGSYTAADSTYNNQATITFAVGQYLRSGVYASAYTGSAFTIYCVGHFTNTSGTHHIWSGTDTSAIPYVANFSTAQLDFEGGSPQTFILGGASTTPTSKSIIVATVAGGSNASNTRINKYSTTTAVGNMSNASIGGITIGGAPSGPSTTGDFAGTWAELIVYQAIHSLAERTPIMDYLAGRYGIGVS